MFDEILPYYNSELRFMRGMARGFAEANPSVASQLRISADTIDDPHVARLMEGFAFLNARTRMKLDDDLPELTTALIDILYPNYLRPFPAMSILEVAPQPAGRGGAVLPAGTRIVTEPVDGDEVRFRTAYPVELWPIELASAAIGGLPLDAPHNPRAARAIGVLRLSLACTAPDVTFGSLGIDRLRFHIHAEPRVAHMLYELIVGGTLSVALADGAADRAPVILGPEAVRPVGFGADETLLPLSPASDPAHALLTEYHGFPAKFMFFDLVGLSAKTLRDGGRTMEAFLYLDRTDAALERLVTEGDFRLFATPVVNLFEQVAEPIRLVPGRFEHRIVPDARREATTEVWSVDRLSVADRAGAEQAYSPFFGTGRDRESDALRYWHLSRRTATAPSGGDDMFVTLVDTNGRMAADADHVASIDLTCTNRNLAAALPFGGGLPRLTFVSHGSLVSRAALLAAPTPTLRPKRGPGALWRLISHLSTGRMSLADPELALPLVKELLVLHELQPTAAGRTLRERLRTLATGAATARAPAAGHIAFISGVDATLGCADHRLSGSGLFLLGAVLDRLFASMAAINAFTRLRLDLVGEREPWQRWPARTGTRTLA